MTSSPGWMVIETSSMWSASGRSLLVGLGLPSRTAFHQAGIIRTEHFDDGVAVTQSLHAVGDGESPSLLIP
jgi:hypothetical protein